METIITGDDEESEDHFSSEDDDGQCDDDCSNGIEDDSSTGVSHRRSVKKTARSFGRRRKNAGPCRRQKSMSAVTVHLRHQPSKVLFVWRTAGVQDTCGAELHEGGGVSPGSNCAERGRRGSGGSRSDAMPSHPDDGCWQYSLDGNLSRFSR